jgi:hypothetical protein
VSNRYSLKITSSDWKVQGMEARILSMAENRNFGKKVFFLYPPSIVDEQLLEIIIQAEYEVYLLHDHEKIHRFFHQFPNSVIYINIDHKLKEKEWQDLISSLQSDPETKNLIIGILTHNPNKELAEKYLMEMGITGGYIRLRIGVKESIKTILTTLNAFEAKGERKFVRADCSDVKASFNLNHKGRRYEGQISDISAAGFAGTFNGAPDFGANTLLRDTQLNLKGTLVKAPLSVMGSREIDGILNYIFIFDKHMEPYQVNKVRGFVHKTLQAKIKKAYEGLP